MTVKLDKLLYFRLVRTCPVIGIVTILTICFSLFAFIVYRDALPMFDDPTIGFEARNTDLSNRINTWRLLIESTSWNGALSLYPKSFISNNVSNDLVEESINIRRTNVTGRIKSKKQNRDKIKRKNKAKKSNQPYANPFESKNHYSSSFFCGKIVGDYVQIVVETNDGTNLLDLKSIKNLCLLDQRMLRMENDKEQKFSLNNSTIFNEYCESKNFDKCCPSWSIANFILIFVNKTNYDDLIDEDLEKFVKHLDVCSAFYAGHYLNEDCSIEEPCPNTPPECFQHENLVFNVFHYLVDYRFMNMDRKILNPNQLIETSNNDSATTFPLLRSTSIILPIAKSSKLMAYYENITKSLKTFSHSLMKNNDPFSALNLIQLFRPSSSSASNDLSFGNVAVVAADMGLKYTLFNKSLISDLLLPSLAGLIIMISLLIFTRSTLLTVMTLLTNLASLSTAYFIYTFVFNINFFPFLNLLSLIILVAIGSDNALIYCKTWSCASHHRSSRGGTNSLITRRLTPNYETELSQILNHVLMSSFCASFTTCGAFFAGYFSDITSLKCFSIFSGLAIITNFFITAIVFPSAIVISDRIIEIQQIFIDKYCSFKLIEKFHWPDCLKFIFDKIILKLIFNYYYLLTFILTLISILSAVVVIYEPGLQLPTSQEFQIFYSNHLFERYDFEYRNMFWFSRIDTKVKTADFVSSEYSDNQKQQTGLTQSNFVLPIRVVFGILPEDNGNFLDPFDRGKLIFDENFNISSQRSQVWLLEFCRELRSQPFYKPTLGPLLTNCFIETLQSWMLKRKCSEIVGNDIIDHFPCCEMTKFPYEPYVFNYCSAELIDRLHRTPNFIFNTHQAGPRFDVKTGSFKALVIEYDSIFDGFSTSFETIDHVWKELNTWVEERLDMAPEELKSGWFITNNMEFYALQHSLSTGVIKSLFISVLFAFITLVFTTMHLRLSIVSIITITFIIFSSIATLVLLGWKLNIIESIVISLTIGLSIDATLHYTIAYKMLTKFQDNRLLGIQMTVARIGSPVAMGSITTFIAGAIMLLSNVLAYIQIGTFLMVISFFSFIFSTLFHMSLLIIFGCTKSVTGSNCLSFDSFRKWIRKQKVSSNTNQISLVSKNFKQSSTTNNYDHVNNNNNSNSINNLYVTELSSTTTLPRSSINSVCLRVTSI